MSGIHESILNHVKDELERVLMTEVIADDLARPGVIMIGDLNGEPDPDVARISVTLYENDPDQFLKGAASEYKSGWQDEVEDIEIGNQYGAITWVRRFTIKVRCLFEQTREDLATARLLASTVRTRIEHLLPRISFANINVDGEYVSRPIISYSVTSEMLQGGGPPDAYDFFIKIRFEVLTTAV